MSLTFLPSLEHLAFVKVALIAYNDVIIHLYDKLECIKSVERLGYYFYTSIEQERWISEIKDEVKIKLSGFLPTRFLMKIFDIFQPLVDEFYYWVRDHWIIVKHIDRSHFTESLCWKSEGTINRIMTANRLIRNERIDKRFRFVIACIYFRENDVLHLWKDMTEYERQRFCSTKIDFAVTFWVRWLESNRTTPWAQCILGGLFINLEEIRWCHDERNRVRLSSFFNVLDISRKKYILCFLSPNLAHFDDLRLCYGQANEAERAEIFYRRIGDVLCSYLDWPLQSLFLNVANQVRYQLSDVSLLNILHYIVEEKLLLDIQDFDYLQLLKIVWNWIPEGIVYPREYKGTGILSLARAAINYDERTHRLPFREFLHECKAFLVELYINKKDPL